MPARGPPLASQTAQGPVRVVRLPWAELLGSLSWGPGAGEVMPRSSTRPLLSIERMKLRNGKTPLPWVTSA
eukprot:1253276-Pyramimonas_sp.AAC.1